jgi:hypothetical protein
MLTFQPTFVSVSSFPFLLALLEVQHYTVSRLGRRHLSLFLGVSACKPDQFESNMQFLARDSSVGRAVDCRIFNSHPSVTGSTPVRETAKESFLITPAPK